MAVLGVSLVWGEVVGAPLVCQGSRRIGARLDVEIGDGCAAAARAIVRFVEQVDIVAADSFVQILLDVDPALRLQVLYQCVERTLVAVASDHHIGDEEC